MATDATGAPTPLGIPKYNVSVDAPSGLGFNAAMDSIDSIITAKQLPTASGSNKVPVWNGTNWVAQTVPPAGITPGGDGQVLGMLAGAPAWLGGLGKIGDVTLGSAANLIDFDNIPATYAHLLAIGNLRTDQAVQDSGGNLRFNNDAGTSYVTQELYGNISTVAAVQGAGAGAIPFAVLPGASASASRFGSFLTLISNYRESHHKMALTFSTYHDGIDTHIISIRSGIWYSQTSAISRVSFYPFGTNYVTNSRISLYGIG